MPPPLYFLAEIVLPLILIATKLSLPSRLTQGQTQKMDIKHSGRVKRQCILGYELSDNDQVTTSLHVGGHRLGFELVKHRLPQIKLSNK